MNTYTNKNMFTDSAEYILGNSKLLIKSDCAILDNVLYERLTDSGELKFEHKYRFFFSVDDYDYLENEQCISRLDSIFNSRSTTRK